MLIDFEKITEDLNDKERFGVLPLIVKGISNYKGKANAIPGSVIIKRLNESGKLGNYKLNAVKLRKIIQCIRINGLVNNLCSCSKGYYVASNLEELDNCIDSLEQRISQQELVVKALIWQRQRLAN